MRSDFSDLEFEMGMMTDLILEPAKPFVLTACPRTFRRSASKNLLIPDLEYLSLWNSSASLWTCDLRPCFNPLGSANW